MHHLTVTPPCRVPTCLNVFWELVKNQELITTNEADSGLYVARQQASANETVGLLCSEVECDADGS